MITHTGYRRRDVHANVYERSACRTHALSLEGAPQDRRQYAALCGETLWYYRHDEWGDDVPNVRHVTDAEARPVTCKRCLRLIRPARREE